MLSVYSSLFQSLERQNAWFLLKLGPRNHVEVEEADVALKGSYVFQAVLKTRDFEQDNSFGEGTSAIHLLTEIIKNLVKWTQCEDERGRPQG